jgi:hypothetical protein
MLFYKIKLYNMNLCNATDSVKEYIHQLYESIICLFNHQNYFQLILIYALKVLNY